MSVQLGIQHTHEVHPPTRFLNCECMHMCGVTILIKREHSLPLPPCLPVSLQASLCAKRALLRRQKRPTHTDIPEVSDEVIYVFNTH